ncbi:Fe-S cluster assembly sulfur transfer protein SufU [Spirochaetia bacterium 38H-sp]|uniref:Fe-S cluster assembly sulfur transfer protein SufU n=1 Tax=Rarispira pelagica TaxID=3141764 RepID=A0ABU9UFJ6_9SPIR
MQFNDLYQEILLDHYKHPRNRRDLSHIPDSHLHNNPTCGDSVKLEVDVKDGIIEKVYFDGHGCAIDMASASIMTDIVKGKSKEEAISFVENVLAVLRGESKEPLDNYGDLVVFSGLRDYPVRVKCATLPWHALLAELKSLK